MPQVPLRDFREATGLTRAALAGKLNLNYTQIREAETNKPGTEEIQVRMRMFLTALIVEEIHHAP